jgi:hypothetical protein
MKMPFCVTHPLETYSCRACTHARRCYGDPEFKKCRDISRHDVSAVARHGRISAKNGIHAYRNPEPEPDMNSGTCKDPWQMLQTIPSIPTVDCLELGYRGGNFSIPYLHCAETRTGKLIYSRAWRSKENFCAAFHKPHARTFFSALNGNKDAMRMVDLFKIVVHFGTKSAACKWVACTGAA